MKRQWKQNRYLNETVENYSGNYISKLKEVNAGLKDKFCSSEQKNKN